MIKKIICSIMLLGIITLGIYCNLKMNSVYYAKNMPHSEGSEPELTMLVDNLWWVNRPKIEDLKYDMDGTNSIVKDKEMKAFDSNKAFNSDYEDNSGNIYIYMKEGMFFIFNGKLKLISASKDWKEDSKLDISTIDEKKVKQEIHELVKPVIDEQDEPIINLQWLFNYLYKDDFK